MGASQSQAFSLLLQELKVFQAGAGRASVFFFDALLYQTHNPMLWARSPEILCQRQTLDRKRFKLGDKYSSIQVWTFILTKQRLSSKRSSWLLVFLVTIMPFDTYNGVCVQNGSNKCDWILPRNRESFIIICSRRVGFGNLLALSSAGTRRKGISHNHWNFKHRKPTFRTC